MKKYLPHAIFCLIIILSISGILVRDKAILDEKRESIETFQRSMMYCEQINEVINKMSRSDYQNFISDKRVMNLKKTIPMVWKELGSPLLLDDSQLDADFSHFEKNCMLAWIYALSRS